MFEAPLVAIYFSYGHLTCINLVQAEAVRVSVTITLKVIIREMTS